MILRTEEILDAVTVMRQLLSSSFKNSTNTLLQLKTDQNRLMFHMSDSTYDVKFSVPCNEEMNATIDADLFLSLIPKITSETIELEIANNILLVKSSGVYKFPLVYKNDVIFEISDIPIDNVTKTWTVDGNILNSILVNNSKQLTLGVITAPVQRLFYVDREGAITFTTGACVNKFDFGADVKVLLPETAVKSFSLFKGKQVEATLGYDAVSNSFLQPKIRLKSDNLTCTYILPFDDASLASVPVDNIRKMALDTYDNSIVLDCEELDGTFERISVFADRSSSKNIMFEFDKNLVTISTLDGEVKEQIYTNDYVSSPTKFVVDLRDLRYTVVGSSKHTTLNFSADSPAIIFNTLGVYHVIPKIQED